MNDAARMAVYAVLAAFTANIILCPLLIPYLIKFKFGQHVRGDGPATHLKKAGTPTMGGIMIIAAFCVASLLFLNGSREGAAVVLVAFGYGLIGFADDYVKIKKKRSLGLKAYQKLLAQVLIAVIFILYWRTLPGYGTDLLVPFFPGFKLDLGIFYAPFVGFIFISTSNGANLTDGLDGLAAGVTAAVVFFFLFAAQSADPALMPVLGAALGSLMGFLLFNAYPARVIMGDTGSQALGGLVAAAAVLLKMPLFLAIVAFVYVAEALSVIIQVGYFKLTRGRRFFKMAPIHHSFELSGWPETKVVTFFCVMTAVFCFAGYLGLRGF